MKELSESVRAKLLDPLSWQEGLQRFARATNLAVMLTDREGCALGGCVNPRPTWSMLRRAKPVANGECPFCIQPFQRGHNCVEDAIETASPVTTSDSAGLVHLAVPLFLFNQPLGALVAGQVFDHYPDHLQLHKLARQLQLSSGKVWLSARAEYPIRREALEVYGQLLETLSGAFVQASYREIADAERLHAMSRLRDLSAEVAVAQRELAAQRARQIEFTDKILEQTREQLRAVTSQLVTAQEEERKRLAADLHDSIGQGIVLFQFEVHALQKAIPKDARQPLRARFEALTGQISDIAHAVRELSHELHPSILTDLGLEEAVRQLVERLQNQYSLSMRFSVRNIPEGLDPAVSLGLYRIIQEALQNVVRHAGAAAVEVAVIGRSDCFEVLIADDGKGFAPQVKNGGLGLINMAQRAELLGASFAVESSAGRGTKIHVRVPLPPLSP